MEKEQSAVEAFLAGTENSESPFKEEDKDPFEKPIEEQQEEEVKEEKPLPFYKDPKIQKYIEKQVNKQLEKQGTQEINRETPTEDKFKKVLDTWTTVLGNDTPEKISALNALKESLEDMDNRGANRAREVLEEIQNREAQADQEAEEELETAFDNIEETFDVDFSKNPKLRSEFATFVEKIAPKDQNGEITDYPDMTSAWETFDSIRNANKTPSKAKELASRSMARSSETQATVPTKRMTFDDFDNILSDN